MSYLVIDDFCPQVDIVRESALAAGFSTWLPNKGEVGSSIYEGMGFWGEHAPMIRSLTNIMGCVVIPNTMYFRYTIPGMEKAYIHSDRMSGKHTCICYLTEHEEQYGTAFYKHIPTGMLEMPTFQDMQQADLFDSLKKDMVSRTPEHWELVDFVKGRKNRALIFNAPLFHSRFPLEGIGTSPKDARMVWASHFNKLLPNGEFA
jgi:hypothetical protein